MVQEMQCIVAQESDDAPVDSGRQIEEICEERRCAVLMIDNRHEDVLDDVKQDVWRKEGADGNIKAISEFQYLGAS